MPADFEALTLLSRKNIDARESRIFLQSDEMLPFNSSASLILATTLIRGRIIAMIIPFDRPTSRRYARYATPVSMKL